MIQNSFSKRIAPKTDNQLLELTTMSEELKNTIWNLCTDIVEQFVNTRTMFHSGAHSHRQSGFGGGYMSPRRDPLEESNLWGSYGKELARSVLRIPVDNVRVGRTEWTRSWLLKEIRTLPYNQIYEILEETFAWAERPVSSIPEINMWLERENSGYRMLNTGELVPLTNAEELATIQDALCIGTAVKYDTVRCHIEKAVEHFRRKPTPDIHKTIEESIHALEAFAREYTGKPSVVLSAALKQEPLKSKLHPCLLEGIEKLYAYAGDEGGIRHSLKGSSRLSLAEARFALVTCSAISNFLMELTIS